LIASRPKLSADEAAIALETTELCFRPLGGQTEPRCRLRGRERPASARVKGEQAAERSVSRLEKRIRQAGGRHRTDRVAVAARVLRGDQAGLPSDTNLHRAALGLERLGQGGGVLAGPKGGPR